VFTNAHVDVSVACADSPLLKLDRHHGHHRAYEIEMRVCYCEFDGKDGLLRRPVLLGGMELLCERHLPHEVFSWLSEIALDHRGARCCLKNKETKAVKRSKSSEKLCLEGKTIDDCECEQWQGEFLSLREEYQLIHCWAYDDNHVCD
jgi:hypothetical protein